ncbi:hypothetical protein DIS24_g4092 [Lasiodiplodia hormozganensis]|uniref:Xylanolytic transcriptional activator regulatory domain-containing protein n=1 Tax=Lasiodiplodia hormozganensis TaxID=869390 RepID=A0AA40D3J3_9PEZI|nr:hypothetical protein DIS24_g4092 [Lasiodiplodia hormozganensis]
MNTVGLDFDLGIISEPLWSNQHGGESAAVAGATSPGDHSAVEKEHGKPRRIPDASIGDDDFHELKPLLHPWQVTEEHRRQFQLSLAPFSDVLGNFTLPSRLSLARCIAGYVDGFSNHHSFIHVPTFSITAHSRAPEMVLAVLAIGAQYRYEKRNSLVLYNAARSIVLERIRRRDPCPEGPGSENGANHRQASHHPQSGRMDIVRTLLLLATFSTWQRDQTLVRESFEYQGLVARYIREDGLSESIQDDGDDWLEWSRIEVDRRTKLCAFGLLNLQTLAYNLPPALLSNEIDLRLPTSCEEWSARGPSEWLKAREDAPRMIPFKEALAALLRSTKQPTTEPALVTSPMGNFILIQALLQRMYITQQLSVEPEDRPFRDQDVGDFEEALDRWRHGWQKAPESVLDLKNSKGSMSFASTALLGLAHVRLHFELGCRRRLQSGNPDIVATEAFKAPPPQRSPRLLQALLHSAHALNIPVQLGVDYLTKCQAFFWGVQHSLCSFECAVFLSKWLCVLSSTCAAQPLTELEHQIIRWLDSIVQEAKTSLDQADEIIYTGDETPGDRCSQISMHLYRLSIAVVRVFAHMFKRCNSTWPVVEVIGQSLERYADLLQERRAPQSG